MSLRKVFYMKPRLQVLSLTINFLIPLLIVL